VLELLVDEGYDESNCFIEPQGYQVIIELAHNFVEEILDTYKHKKKELTVNDIKRAVGLKFPDIYIGDNEQNKVYSQNRATALDENDDKVRDAEKKFSE
jgi:hypothetical protein